MTSSGCTWTRRPRRSWCASLNERTQIQALDRTAPILPMRPGIPEKQTHDYKRNGATTLFTALEVATGLVTDRCFQQTNVEFLTFLKQVAPAYPRVPLHVVCDNYATHSRSNVTAWLAKHPRVQLHFTPASGSWFKHGRNLLRDHHPASHPPRHVPQRQRPRNSHLDLHQRVERTRPPIHLDQKRQRDHRPRQTLTPPQEDLQPATLAGARIGDVRHTPRAGGPSGRSPFGFEQA